jgi:hypothetical protein
LTHFGIALSASLKAELEGDDYILWLGKHRNTLFANSEQSSSFSPLSDSSSRKRFRIECFGTKKTAGMVSGGFSELPVRQAQGNFPSQGDGKLERAKRLELIRVLLQALQLQLKYLDALPHSTPGRTLGRCKQNRPDCGSSPCSSPQGACFGESGSRGKGRT